jgi:hypothetical protein
MDIPFLRTSKHSHEKIKNTVLCIPKLGDTWINKYTVHEILYAQSLGNYDIIPL